MRKKRVVPQKKHFSREQADALALRAQRGSRPACSRLIVMVEPLLHKLGRRWFNRLYHGHKDDLLQEFRMAVIDSLRHFDPLKGSFTTYMSWWARARGMKLLESVMKTAYHVSLDAPTPDGSDHTDVPDESYEDRLDEMAMSQMWARARAEWERLDPRSREIISRRFSDGATLNEIGNDMGLSRERVRQLEAAALDRIRRKVA